jgi:hypothetical protein
MQDRVVIITGGGTGIGRAAALQFAQAGASIVVVGRRATPLEGVASVSDRIVPIVADIQQEPDIRDIVHSTTKRVVTLSPSPDLRVPRAALNLKAGGVNGSTTLEAAERQRMIRVLQASRSQTASKFPFHWWGVNPALSGRHQLNGPPGPHSVEEGNRDASDARDANPRGYANRTRSASFPTDGNKIMTQFGRSGVGRPLGAAAR